MAKQTESPATQSAAAPVGPKRLKIRYVHGPLELYREGLGHLRIGDIVELAAEEADSLISGGQFERTT